MALLKQKEFKGYVGEYWKIVDIQLDLVGSKMKVSLGLFKDRDARSQGKNNMLTREVFSFGSPEQFYAVAQMTVIQMVGWAYQQITAISYQDEVAKDEDGNILLDEENNPIIIQVEIPNWFSDAENVMEV